MPIRDVICPVEGEPMGRVGYPASDSWAEGLVQRCGCSATVSAVCRYRIRSSWVIDDDCKRSRDFSSRALDFVQLVFQNGRRERCGYRRRRPGRMDMHKGKADSMTVDRSYLRSRMRLDSQKCG